MTVQMDPDFASALRGALIEKVEASTKVRRTKLLSAAVALVVLIGGGVGIGVTVGRTNSTVSPETHRFHVVRGVRVTSRIDVQPGRYVFDPPPEGVVPKLTQRQAWDRFFHGGWGPSSRSENPPLQPTESSQLGIIRGLRITGTDKRFGPPATFAWGYSFPETESNGVIKTEWVFLNADTGRDGIDFGGNPVVTGTIPSWSETANKSFVPTYLPSGARRLHIERTDAASYCIRPCTRPDARLTVAFSPVSTPLMHRPVGGFEQRTVDVDTHRAVLTTPDRGYGTFQIAWHDADGYHALQMNRVRVRGGHVGLSIGKLIKIARSIYPYFHH